MDALPENWVRLGDGWTIAQDGADYDRALKCVRGTYQKDIVLGREALSGSTLKGKASKWSTRYRQSRDALLQRFEDEGVQYKVVTLGKRKVLAIGELPKPSIDLDTIDDGPRIISTVADLLM